MLKNKCGNKNKFYSKPFCIVIKSATAQFSFKITIRGTIIINKIRILSCDKGQKRETWSHRKYFGDVRAVISTNTGPYLLYVSSSIPRDDNVPCTFCLNKYLVLPIISLYTTGPILLEMTIILNKIKFNNYNDSI